MKVRLDALLVERGLAADLKKARALIMAGQVVVGAHRAESAGQQIPADSTLRLKGRATRRFVSRAGEKLAPALDHFEIRPTDWCCLDVGASTGGFTDCLLQRGARRIYAVDVGHNQLHWQLRQDPRVVDLSNTDARALDTELVPEPVDLLVADVSFNALGRVLEPAVALMRPGAPAVLLVKPQFELDRGEVGEGGVVRDPALWAKAIERVAAGARAVGLTPGPHVRAALAGAHGNVEFLLLAHRG